MIERIYTLEIINPQLFYGPNNIHWSLIMSKFPKLQFVARGEEIKMLGDETSMNSFEAGMKVLEKLYTAKGELTEHIIHEALHIDYKANQVEVSTSDDVLLIGTPWPKNQGQNHEPA